MFNSNFRDVEGKVALVTGAHRGIGLSTAKRLASGGAKVIMADLSGVDLAGAVAQVAEFGEVLSCNVNISDEASVKELVAFAMDTAGRVDILDNNAAYAGSATDVDIATMDVDEWDKVFAINTRGTMLMCKHVINAMITTGGGSIVNISSGTAQVANMYQSAYGCSKAAINTMTKYIATQYGAQGVRCNAIAAGLIKTEKLAATMPEPMQEVYRGAKLIPRLGKPEDIAEMVAFLGSDRSEWITGQIYAVDGGFLAQSPQLQSEQALLAQMQMSLGD
ncbi:MAG: SDR family oxidoreductase [Spongiibacteraceae bacterium]